MQDVGVSNCTCYFGPYKSISIWCQRAAWGGNMHAQCVVMNKYTPEPDTLKVSWPWNSAVWQQWLNKGNNTGKVLRFKSLFNCDPVSVGCVKWTLPPLSPSGISICSSLMTTTYRSTTGCLTPRLPLCPSSRRTKQTSPTTRWSSGAFLWDNLWSWIPEPPAVCLKTVQWLQMPLDWDYYFSVGSKTEFWPFWLWVLTVESSLWAFFFFLHIHWWLT